MKQLQQQFQVWWQGLQQREQRLVLISAVVVVIGILYWGIWQPVRQYQSNQQQRLSVAQQQLEQLNAAIPQLMAAKQGGRRSGSIAQIITQSARSSGVTVSRMQPQADQLTLVLEDLSFAQLLGWLHNLQYQHGVRLVNLELATADKPGVVRVRRMVVE